MFKKAEQKKNSSVATILSQLGALSISALPAAGEGVDEPVSESRQSISEARKNFALSYLEASSIEIKISQGAKPPSGDPGHRWLLTQLHRPLNFVPERRDPIVETVRPQL